MRRELFDKIGMDIGDFTVNITSVTQVDPWNIEIKADRLLMLRGFRNLVDNALKYGGKDLSEILSCKVLKLVNI